MPGSAFWGWAGPLLVTAFGAFLRFNRLSVPHAVIFDETYYVPDALGILRYGVEHNYVSNRNSLIAHGRHPHLRRPAASSSCTRRSASCSSRRASGLFGLTPFGWRFAVALVGSLAILLLARIARRMTRSTLLGCVAGLLLALDGLEFVMSRTALLDIFLMFWVLAAFGCLVVDRDVSRARLAGAGGGPAARRRARPPAGDPLVAAGRRSLPGPGLRVEVGRHLVRVRVRRPDRRLGHRGAAGGRVPRLPARRAGAMTRAGCRLVRAGARGRLPGDLDRLVRHQSAATTGAGRRSTASTPR